MNSVTKEDVEAFGSHCVYMRSAYQYHRLLYESGDTVRNLLSEVANIFFGDLNLIMLEHTFLQICKITDPERDIRGNESLTAAFFMNCSDMYPELRRLNVIGQELEQFGKKIKLARHKLIAHLDRKAVLSGEALGAVSIEEWNQFWLNLQSFVQILYAHYLSEPNMHINGIVNTSGADSLLKALEQSQDLEKLLKDQEILKKWASMKEAEYTASVT